MSDSYPDIKSVVVRVITNKPVRKTPYQVKGVFMRQYPNEDIIPMLDGTYRDRYLYPRVQVKILNEQIYLIGINEGVDSVISLNERLKSLDFGNITFDVEHTDLDSVSNQFTPSDNLVHYKFITPWVALNHMTGGKYKFLTNQEKPSYLNKLLGQNIIFLAKEVGVDLTDDILTKVKVSSLFPKPLDDNKWGAFMGAFKTNFILPNYIGIGNGITRGYGTIYGASGSDALSFDENELNKSEIEDFDDSEGVDSISASDVPNPKRKRYGSGKKRKFIHKNKPKDLKNKKKKKYSTKNQRKQNKHYNASNRKKQRHRHIISEDYDIEEESGDTKKQNNNDHNDDQRFNTEEHHKKQHKF